MSTKDFLQYIRDNFNMAGEFARILCNAIEYAKGFDDPDEGLDFLCDMLDGTIGIAESEIRRLNLEEH